MSLGSLPFVKLGTMSSAPAKSAGDPRYSSQDPFIQSTLSDIISTPICVRSAFFLRRTQQFYHACSNLIGNATSFQFKQECCVEGLLPRGNLTFLKQILETYMLVSGTSDFQGATIRAIVPRQKRSCFYCSPLIFFRTKVTQTGISNY